MIALRLLALSSLLIPLTAVAQSSPDTDLNVPMGHVRIPVLVTDKQGKPVSSLHEDDFKVFDNGKPASVDGFRAFATAAPFPERFTVFYLDDRHLSAEQMNGAKQAVAAAVPLALDSNGYAAIVTGTGSVNSGFSRNADQLRQTLDSIKPTAFAGVGTRAHDFDLIGIYASLADYATRMSKLPGRRLLVILSPGFFANFPEIHSAAEVCLDRVIQSGVVVNALDMQGSPSFHEDSIGLEELSSATGGLFFPASATAASITQYPELLYLLDIPLSAVRADGSTHQLKVKVSHPGMHLRVRVRKSFVAPRESR